MARRDTGTDDPRGRGREPLPARTRTKDNADDAAAIR